MPVRDQSVTKIDKESLTGDCSATEFRGVETALSQILHITTFSKIRDDETTLSVKKLMPESPMNYSFRGTTMTYDELIAAVSSSTMSSLRQSMKTQEARHEQATGHRHGYGESGAVKNVKKHGGKHINGWKECIRRHHSASSVQRRRAQKAAAARQGTALQGWQGCISWEIQEREGSTRSSWSLGRVSAMPRQPPEVARRHVGYRRCDWDRGLGNKFLHLCWHIGHSLAVGGPFRPLWVCLP